MSSSKRSSSRRGRREDPSDGTSGLSDRQQRYYSRSRRKRHATENHLDSGAAVQRDDHPMVCADPPAIITDAAALGELIDHLRSVGSYAFDTEFIGELTHAPKLCVLQVATTQRVALVDPLAGLDLAPFWATVVDPSVRTIVHAGVQDLEPAWRLTGEPPRAVFDTQIALGLAGLPYPLSLREALDVLLGVRLGKSMTFTQWDHRPLSPSQIRYAADDVRYLPALADETAGRLAALGHDAWAAEECASLSDEALYRFDPLAQCRRLRGTRSLTARQLAVAVRLLAWREEVARGQNVPARAVVRDEAVKALAQKKIASVEELYSLDVLPRHIIRLHGERIVEAVREGLAADDLPAVRPEVETSVQRSLVDSLWAAIQAWCFGRSVHPALVTSRQELVTIFADGVSAGRLAASRLSQGWRKALLGDVLAAFLDGTTTLTLGWDGRLTAHRPAGAQAMG
ncbi:MAG: hypothetical protein GX591_07155 [Planctomycetes bacterium]|nr:hypothetical protein [Planctomycetota bacterium]